MSPRPSNGRMRPRHSISGAVALGIVIASFAIIIFVMVGGGQR